MRRNGRGMTAFSRAVVTAVMIAIAALSAPALAQGEPTVVQGLADIEMVLYGRLLSGAILERLTQVEGDLFGKPQDGSILDRLARIRGLAGGGPGTGPSVGYKLSAVEWFVQRQVTTEPAVAKLEKLETMVFGQPGEGSMTARADKLAVLCLPDGALRTKEAVLPLGEPVRIKLLGKLDSSSTQKGQRIDIEVAADLVIGNELVMPKGTRGYGVVTEVSPAGRLGRDGKIALQLKEVRTLDGTLVPLAFDEKTEKLNESTQLAIGAGFAGFIVFGPVGALGAVFVPGKDVSIPEGVEFYVAVGSDTRVLGLTLPVDLAVELGKEPPVVQLKPGK